jgi:large repetitive protein
VRRHAVVLLFGIGALLLTPGAAGVPDVPGDPTPPVVTPVITGTLGSVGWYTTNVTVNWTVVDPESIILSTTGCNATTFTTNTTGTPLSCSAESDGGTTTVAKTFKVDKTAPATSATPSRTADANGWYNHDLTVGFTGTDTTSGLESCSADAAYSGPDTTGTTVSGSCRDRAGNTAPASLALKYDETAPQATAAARTPDANGWFNHAVAITFQGADATSGVDSCSQTTYAGPDDPSVALSGTCRDRAGNQSASAPFTLRYDETPPQASATASRAADVNGWHNRPLTVSFTGSDTTSGLDSCDAPKSYAGPDAASVTISGACRDLAGNLAPRSVVVKYDATAPQVTATPARAANASGWYNAPLSVSFAGTDPVSGVASCVGPQSYPGPDNAAASVAGSCTDQAGNVRNAPFPLKYDASAPQVTATPARPAGLNGWYSAPLSVSFAGTDATAGIETCDAAKTYSSPDAAAATVSGSCRDRAGNSATGSLPLKYDATAPQVTAAPNRAANINGWYNAALTVSFTGGDATSGVDSCDAPKSYGGPDSASTTVAGNCRDRAGNTGAGSFGLKYDATAPQTAATTSRAADANGWFNHALTVSFAGTDATAGIEACDPAKSYAGPDSGLATVTGACRDRAGNAGQAALALKYDGTVPLVTGASASRPADLGGWYNRSLSVGFHGSDATSGIESCTQVAYAGPDSSAATVNGSCGDRAGNRSSSTTFGFKYDATAPQVTASPARATDTNGWYNHPLAVSFAGTDTTAGIGSCDPTTTFAGPDTVSVSVGGGCRDRAGNLGSGTFALKYDATGPAATATPSRQPNANGWYNAPLTVAFAGTDATSGLASCDAVKSYSGPDSALAAVGGTCRDQAGNASSASRPLQYDATPPTAAAVPTRVADANGWYNHPLAVGYAGTDATSGVETCSAQQSYAGPDSSAVSFSGSCRDRAGNQGGPAGATVKYDATAPQIAGAIPVRAPDRAGWYNRPVAFAAQGTDATSGLDSCPSLTYGGPDGADASVSAACIDRAGNRASRSFPLRYDATGPATTATAGRGPDANGWYNRPLTVSFAGADPASGLDSCDPPQSYDGPDSAFAVVGGVCLDKAGNVGLASLAVSYDATAPQVTGASPSRQPDANGWYNRALVVSFHGSDVTSQIEACTEASYAGPDAAGASLTGSCRDRAGNGSAAWSFPLRFDGTAPSLSAVRAKSGNARAELSWTASPDTKSVEIRRGGRLVYRGTGKRFIDTRLKNGVRYRYALTGYDEAANGTTTAVTARPTAPLFSPAAGATVSVLPRLAWVAAENATYYNVQLLRRGKKILSAWPKETSMTIRRSWMYNGRRYRLTPGRYRWYVWPGYGRRAEQKYGPLLGSSSFVVR